MARSVAIMARLESVLEEHYLSSNSLSSGSNNRMNSNSVEQVEVSVDAGGGAPTRVTPGAFDGVYRSTAEYLATRLEPLHWSDKHQGTYVHTCILARHFKSHLTYYIYSTSPHHALPTLSTQSSPNSVPTSTPSFSRCRLRQRPQCTYHWCSSAVRWPKVHDCCGAFDPYRGR